MTFRRRGLVALLPVLAIGAIVATYLVVAHLELFHGTGSFESLCNFGKILSCDVVNTSDWSELGGVGIALFAIPLYATLAFLTTRALRAPPKQRLAPLALAHAVAWLAVACSALLLAVMVFELHTLCIFCLTLDAVNVAALVLTVWCVKTSPRRLLARVPEFLRSELRGLVLPSAAIAASTLGLALIAHAHLKGVLEAEARAAVLAPSTSSSSSDARDRDDTLATGRKLPTKRWEVAVDDDDASIGPKDARVTLVEFGDFQCGYCKKLEGALSAVRRNFPDRVRLVFKHFPMDPRCNRSVHNQKHEYSCDAAVSAECARRQGKFWPLHDLLYENQSRLKPGDIDRLAETVGLDLQAYSACTKDPSALEAVLHDTDEGGRLSVSGTPRTFINGRLFAGALSEELLTFVIRVELGEVTGTEAEAYTGRVEP